MIALITKITRQKQWKTTAALFVLLFGLALAQHIAAANNPALAGMTTHVKSGAAAKAVDTNKEIMVNNVWVDVPLTQVFRDISMETGIIIASCPHVIDSLVSLDAGSGKPLQECLQELVAGQSLLIHKKNEQFYLIGCGQTNCPSFMEIAGAKRLDLKYITSKHLQSCLPRSIREYVSDGERQNEVLIYAPPEIMKHIMEIVNKLDIPSQQVILEVLVVELWEEASNEFGLDWSYKRQGVTAGISKGLEIFTGMAGYTNVPADQFTNLLLTLRMLVGKGKASIRSRPRVATLNGQKATIDISLDEYYSIITDQGYSGSLRTQLQIIKSGVLLEITPHIGDNGDITIDVLTEVSDVASRQSQVTGNNSGNLPVIRRRRANTSVRVKEGDAAVLGGLIETQEQNSEQKIPVLGDLPIISGLFRSTKSNTIEKEVMIFITPRLIEEGKIALSDKHNLIDAKKELGGLLQTAALSDTDGQDESSDRELP
jgi:type II secretory pathway component GspD/PulD (secretin)